MIERNAGLPPERRIEFRVGIHLGDIVEESDGDLMGDGVNIAARLEGIAKPGSICLSEQAYWQVKSQLDLAVSDLGEQSLKNIAEPIRVYSLAVGVPAQAKPTSASNCGVDDDLAVMPAAQFLDRRGGTLNLLGARHQSGAVLQRPAVILHVRDLDPARAERERERHHVLDVIDVGAVHHGVDGERDFEMHDFGGERALPGEGAFVAGDVVGGSALAILDRDLHVIETGFGDARRGTDRR